MAKSRICPIVAVAAGIVLLLVVVIVGWVAYPKIREGAIKSKTRLVEEASTFEKWREIDTPIDFKFYMFNWTNGDKPEEWHLGKAAFQQLGPYVFRKATVKEKLERRDNLLIKYRVNTTYIFDAEKSNGTLEDRIDLPNVPYITVAQMLFYAVPGPLQANVAGQINYLGVLEQEGLVKKNVSIREVLFDGWQLAKKTEGTIWHGIRDAFIPTLDIERFGLYRGRNNSHGEEFMVHTGATNHEMFGNIEAFNRRTELDWWYNASMGLTSDRHYCNHINGTTDGTIYPPFNTKDRPLKIFSDDVCRTIDLEFDTEVQHHKLSGYRYKIPADLFDHPDVKPENECYCKKLSLGQDQRCFRGAFRLFPCKSAPLIGSLPHYYHGEELLQNLTGVGPAVADLHETYIDIEPESGALLRARKRIQLSIEMDHLSLAQYYYGAFTDLPKERSASWIFPLFWVEESADMTQENADDLHKLLVGINNTVNIVRWVMVAVSIVVAGLGGLWLFKVNRSSKSSVST